MLGTFCVLRLKTKQLMRGYRKSAISVKDQHAIQNAHTLIQSSLLLSVNTGKMSTLFVHSFLFIKTILKMIIFMIWPSF